MPDKLSGQGVMKIETYQLTETNKISMVQLEILWKALKSGITGRKSKIYK